MWVVSGATGATSAQLRVHSATAQLVTAHLRRAAPQQTLSNHRQQGAGRHKHKHRTANTV